MSSFQRTYSSPNLKANGRQRTFEWESQLEKHGYDSEDEEFYVIGDRVYVDRFKLGSVAYFGEVEFAQGDWVGVVLDEPLGNHDGRIHGHNYFQCAPMHGIFVRPNRVTRMITNSDSAMGSSTLSSRASTPMTSGLMRYGRYSKSPGASTVDSYYYDEDYRPEKVANVAALRGRRSLRDYKQQQVDDTYKPESYSNLTAPTGGILKRVQPRSHSTEPPVSSSLGDRGHDLARRMMRANSAASSHSSSKSPVFNFRPKRAQLDDNELYNERCVDPPQRHSSHAVNVHTPPKYGDRVVVRSERGQMSGILRFLGQTKFAIGEWAGVELDEPHGKNDGSVLGERYFFCPKGYGLFVPAVRMRLEKSPLVQQVEFHSRPVFDTMRSTVTSPPPALTSTYSSRSTTPGCDTTSSSFTTIGADSPAFISKPPKSLRPTDLYEEHELISTPLRTNTSALNYPRVNYSGRTYNRLLDVKPKFDEKDIDLQLKRTLQRSSTQQPKSVYTSSLEPARPRSVKYTFSSSKYDGNPIARRTVEYN